MWRKVVKRQELANKQFSGRLDHLEKILKEVVRLLAQDKTVSGELKDFMK
jgi:hypothetical protein